VAPKIGSAPISNGTKYERSFFKTKDSLKKKLLVVFLSLVRLVSQACNMEESFPNMFFFPMVYIM
jgi:hypothetical protein